MTDRPTAVLFVCLGNICRSPQAEGVFRQMVCDAGLAREFVVDSAGTGDYHVGEAPDWRTQRTSEKNGVPLDHRARQFTVADFDRFDLILVMDRSNLRDVHQLARGDADRAKVGLLRNYDPVAESPAVPDPYYGDGDGFQRVFEICRSACRGLLRALRPDTVDLSALADKKA